MVATFILEEGF